MLDFRRLVEHRFAIVDPFAHELPADWPAKPLVPELLRDDASVLPCVVDLHALGNDGRDSLLDADEQALRQGERPLSEFLIAADADDRAVMRHCTSRMLLRRTGGQQALLRYYDPRVMSQLAWMLDTDHLAWFFGPLTRITFWLRGEWIGLEADPAVRPRTLLADDALYARLARVGTLNTVVEHAKAPVKWNRLELISRRINALLERAELEHHLADEPSRIAFALHGLRWHERFDTHPRIRDLIAGLDAPDATYRDASALLEDQDWQRIVRELNDASAQGALHG